MINISIIKNITIYLLPNNCAKNTAVALFQFEMEDLDQKEGWITTSVHVKEGRKYH